MRRTWICLLALLLLLVTAGCDSIDSLADAARGDGGAAEENQETPDAEEAPDADGGDTAPGGTDGYPDDDGVVLGYLGDTMHSYFFDYTVNSARLTQTYGTYTAAEGNSLLVVDLTVKNTGLSSIAMYDTDFQAQWNDTAEDAFAMPIEDGLSEAQFPMEYELAIQEERTGELVFEVPSGNQDFSVSYLEFFSDDSTGDVFFVYFTAEQDSAGI